MFIEILFQKSYIPRNTPKETQGLTSLLQAYSSFVPEAIFAWRKLVQARTGTNSRPCTFWDTTPRSKLLVHLTRSIVFEKCYIAY